MAVSCRTASAAAAVRRVSSRAFSNTAVALGEHGHDSTLEPPFHRIPLPSKPLHEQDELIWNDSVAPETAIDFDAPHMSPTQGLIWWLGGFGFFYSIWAFAKSTDHPNNKISAAREFPAESYAKSLGGYAR